MTSIPTTTPALSTEAPVGRRWPTARRVWLACLSLGGAAILAAGGVLAWQLRPDADSQDGPATQAGAALAGVVAIAGASGENAVGKDLELQLERGARLVREGSCLSCHTARGSGDFAGGRKLATSFGDFYAPNITPDTVTGIGTWSADDFWRALHHGRGRAGEFLYPAFPYPNYTAIKRQDADAMYAWLRTITPVVRPNTPHALRFPFSQRYLLAFWRALYFRPAVFVPDERQSVEWNRGAYLVQGPGHCNTCHAAPNFLGAATPGKALDGAMIPVQDWYAPPLHGGRQSGISAWSIDELVELLRAGVAPRAAVFGPMAEVVRQSLQYLPESDIRAMALYLKSLPGPRPDAGSEKRLDDGTRLQQVLGQGRAMYEQQCASCHQASGAGQARVYPPLAGNLSVMAPSAVNPVRMVLNGGFAPGTAGNARPFGMPPFGPFMSDGEVAAVVTYIRLSWTNSVPGKTAEVTAAQVNRYRSIPFE